MPTIRTFRNKRTGHPQRAVILALDAPDTGELLWLVAPAVPLMPGGYTSVSFGDRVEPAVQLLWIREDEWELAPVAGPPQAKDDPRDA